MDAYTIDLCTTPEGLFENDNIIDGTTYRSDGSIEYKDEYKKAYHMELESIYLTMEQAFTNSNRGPFDGPWCEKRMRGKLDHVIEGVGFG